MQRLDARRTSTDEFEEQPAASAELWGQDDDGPVKDITLSPDLPPDPITDDDPATAELLDLPAVRPGGETANVVGVRFVAAGRVFWFDAADAGELVPGDAVLVDSERGQRLGHVATAAARRGLRERLRRVIRKATDRDRAEEQDGDADRARLLRIAKDKAAALRLPLKVFRVELQGQPGRGGKLLVYYTSDDRLDMRQFLNDVGAATAARVELRQLGVRDEAKAVGGIGSCGLTLCCTTWLPDFVPVSIKMAKDQGLVLSPTKVSGQCGRLKCCLVYEQAGYAEMRKGLPKLGKRVISPRGEGRVVEVDVLRQRVRVSYGMGDSEMLPATEVKPLFPPGTQPPAPPRAQRETRGLDDGTGRTDGPADRTDGRRPGRPDGNDGRRPGRDNAPDPARASDGGAASTGNERRGGRPTLDAPLASREPSPSELEATSLDAGWDDAPVDASALAAMSSDDDAPDPVETGGAQTTVQAADEELPEPENPSALLFDDEEAMPDEDPSRDPALDDED